jgi:hypothetical protein
VSTPSFFHSRATLARAVPSNQWGSSMVMSSAMPPKSQNTAALHTSPPVSTWACVFPGPSPGLPFRFARPPGWSTRYRALDPSSALSSTYNTSYVRVLMRFKIFLHPSAYPPLRRGPRTKRTPGSGSGSGARSWASSSPIQGQRLLRLCSSQEAVGGCLCASRY